MGAQAAFRFGSCALALVAVSDFSGVRMSRCGSGSWSGRQALPGGLRWRGTDTGRIAHRTRVDNAQTHFRPLVHHKYGEKVQAIGAPLRRRKGEQRSLIIKKMHIYIIYNYNR